MVGESLKYLNIKSLQETMSRVTKTLDNSKKSTKKRAEDLIIRRFLSDLLRAKSNKQPEDDYNYDPIDNVTDSMAGLTLNRVINTAVKCAVKKSSSGHKCSKCRRSGHNSQNCLWKKKKKSKKSKNNLATVDSDSDSGTSSDTSSSNSSDSESDITVNIAKAKKSEAKV